MASFQTRSGGIFLRTGYFSDYTPYCLHVNRYPAKIPVTGGGLFRLGMDRNIGVRIGILDGFFNVLGQAVGVLQGNAAVEQDM